MIKLCDTSKQPIEIYKAVEDVLKSGSFVKGKKVTEFEEKWAAYCGKKYAIGVSSGASALELAITVLFDKKYTPVITYTAHTYKAVPNAICRMGFLPIEGIQGVDVYAHHLHDQKPDYIPPIEDCSHVHGYKPVAETAIFSLYPAKILGACGDAGIIVTNNPTVYEFAVHLRNHDIPHGTNARMDEIQAVILIEKLKYLDQWIERRKEIVDMYDQALGRKTEGNFHYAYCIPGNEEKRKKLVEAGIESHFYYDFNYMALPLNPYLTNEEVNKVIEVAKAL